MFVVFYAIIVLLTGVILGDTIIKDNPAEFKATATDGNGKKIPVSGAMDTIQVFDIRPFGENYTDPGLNIDINVTPLNDSEEGGQIHSPAATTNPNPNYSQVTSTFTLPSDYSKIDNIMPPTASFDNEAISPFPAQSKTEQNFANPAMMAASPHQASAAGITPMPGHWNKPFPPSSYSNAIPNENLSTTPVPPIDTNPFLTASNPFAPGFSQNLNPSSTNSFSSGVGQNSFSQFPFGGFPTSGNSSIFPADQNVNQFNLSNATNIPAENPFNISSPHPFQPFNNPFASIFGQNTNPFNVFNPANTPFAPSFFNFPTANPSPPTNNPFAPADKNANPFGSFPANPFNFTNNFANFAENPFKPVAKPPVGNPFNPFTPTSTQNILPLGGSLFNKENLFPTGGFPTLTSPNPFLPNFGGVGKPLFGGKPNRVVGPNPDEGNIAIVPRSADDYNETVSSTDHKSDGLLSKLFNLLGSNKSSLDSKNVDYDSQMFPDINNSVPVDYSDMMAAPPGSPVNTDFISPLIYKAYFDPTMWNKFTNITDFDDSKSLGNANNPFAAFNPSASPLAFMRNVNPWNPGNVNNPWNANNFNQALLNLTSLIKTPTSDFGAGFNFPSFAAGSQSPWNFNTSTLGLLETFHNDSSPEFNISSVLQNMNASSLPPVAFTGSGFANSTNSQLPMLQMPQLNLGAELAGAINISDLMKNVGESIRLLTGNSTSQALLLKSLSGGENTVNWPPAALSHNSPKLAPVPLPSPAAAFGTADEPDTRKLPDVHKYVEELSIPQPKKASPIEVETISADEKNEYYGDDPKVGENYETTTEAESVNATPQNGAIVLLSSWMMVIGIVVGVVAQKLCN
ncbi:hypothetical protein V9T40_001821 [Parthenolecanium corni]|uniref:Uncharacterized protein n=1 Tax=Parthenolecanium corni TaxID=536013 RepID=A0AAN9Y4Z7_9HEMI